MTTPYSRPAPLRIRCVATCRSQKALTFVTHRNKIHVGTYKVTMSCALTDGETVYLSVINGSDPEFEEGQSYVVKNFTLSHKYGRPCLFVNRATIKFKTTPLAVTEEAIRTAKEALCPLSPYKTGEEEDIFTHRGYLSLQGQIQKVEVARMTCAQVPILDLRIKCRSKLFDIALWREEALNELYVGDTVELTHLKSTITPDGKRKFVSSNYSTVKIIDRHILEEEVEIIGVSQKDDTLILLDSGLDDFVVPAHFYAGNPDELVKQLPLKLKIRHIQRHVLNIKCLGSVKSNESLNPLQGVVSLDPEQGGKSPAPVQGGASLDPGQS
ncbi:putative C-mannosyltransferase DPY19L3 isoform X1 [Labeo rohita]|uniref:Putative C-mannosyltransferase DPY19L3 isoform X1 n=1 Tax=Labeo rohita TaxID=84645 RepID=A0A498P220_LABRO|nr:putative C-mannosyltransferase DPY19L3 isoform X1 [Labeo rohita]